MTPAAGPLPDDFAEMLSSLLAPGEQEQAAAVLEEALKASDRRLADFLEAVAGRIHGSSEKVTSAELRALLEAGPGA